LGESFGPFSGVQPRIEAELLSRREIAFDPCTRWLINEMLDREQFGVRLVARLKRIAAVDEQHRALGENDGGAGRSRETGAAGEPLLVRRQIFILMAISVGHYEAVKPPPCKFSPQGREAPSGFRRLRGIVESLELGLEIFECHLVHDRILKSLSAPHNSCCRA